jgi:hypothetical protein
MISDNKLRPPRGRREVSHARVWGRQPLSHLVNYPLPAKYFRKMSGSLSS